MTKKKNNEKRRIHIEDKRHRDDGDGDGNGADEAAADAVLDEQLRRFTVEGQADAQPAQSTPDDAANDGEDTGAPVSLEQQAAEYLDLAQRREAELQNYRKRMEKDMADARRFAVEGLLADLFPSFDGLAQAIETYKDTADGENPLLDGVRRTIRSLEAALGKHGIEKINDAPVPFDPELHQALNVEESADVDEDTTVEIYVEGYRLGDTVLKPAMARVVKPKE